MMKKIVDPNVAALGRDVKRLTAELLAERRSRGELEEALRDLTNQIRRCIASGRAS